MSIFKDTFRGYVRDQLALREELINIGNTSDSGNRRDRMGYNTVNLQSGKRITLNPGTYYNYSLNKQCVIRMTSLVDYVEDINLPLSTFENLKGASLSKRFILEGGTLGVGRKTRDSFKTPTKKTNTAYGDPYIASDSSQDGYGVVPMPGITDATIRTKSAYGSLREAKINFECHNRRQLEILEMLYMRPGYMTVVEWGWTPYIGNDGKLKSNLNLIENKVGAIEDGTSKLYTNEITQMGVYNAINKLKEKSGGNYDAFLGIVKNFGFQAREDGGFTCFTEMTSMNEVIDSIKTPNISIFNPIIGGDPNNISTNEEENNIVITSNLEAVTGGYFQSVRNFDADITQEEFNKVSTPGILGETGLFPEFNGLEGLTKNLKIFTTFNSFTLSSILGGTGDFQSDLALGNNLYGDDIEEIFGDLNNTQTEKLSSKLGYNPTNNNDESFISLEQQEKYIFRDLLRFKAKNIQSLLAKKLDLSSNDSSTESFKELKNYIIPKQGFENVEGGKVKSVEEIRNESGDLTDLVPGSSPQQILDYYLSTGDFTPEDAGVEIEVAGNRRRFVKKNDQSFIRWDAFVVLINEALVTTNEKDEKPVYLVCDKIIDLDNNISRYDPLKYNEIIITTPEGLGNVFGADEPGVERILDFSCDPNVCILPHQFEENIRVARQIGGSQFGGDSIITKGLSYEDIIGYKPDTSVFTNRYHKSIFNKSGIIYDDQPLLDSTKLSKTDKNFRIGNIFLNIEMLDEIAEKNSDKSDYTLGNYINDIWEKVNEVCPNHNFVLTDDKEANVVYIIDLPVNQKDIPKTYHEFIPFSNKNILRQFDYTSNVPNALSATVAIQAQDPRSIEDIDGVTFAAFNRSIKNRIQSIDTNSNFANVQNNVASRASRLRKEQNSLFFDLQTFQLDFFRRLTAQANEKTLPGGNIKGKLRQFQANAAYADAADDIKKGSSFNSVIPLEFNAELDGISGMVIGNIFKIRKDRLPRAYKKANIGFIVFSEEQSITAGGDWTTRIGGKMTILND